MERRKNHKAELLNRAIMTKRTDVAMDLFRAFFQRGVEKIQPDSIDQLEIMMQDVNTIAVGVLNQPIIYERKKAIVEGQDGLEYVFYFGDVELAKLQLITKERHRPNVDEELFKQFSEAIKVGDYDAATDAILKSVLGGMNE